MTAMPKSAASHPGDDIPHVISLGAGVQSTTMALMAAHGLLTPMPIAAIFADTGAEPEPVYDHLDWLSSGFATAPRARRTVRERVPAPPRRLPGD